ncbi:NemA protein, partial [Neisseria cinerea]|uniref:NemA protein n=1 Tax=Neisseria cinerea TaxID=483 RepID=UPI0027E1607B
PPPAADTGGINVTGEQIITHFAADGTASEQAVKGSSYHRLLNVLGGGNYLVQDFYGDGQKRTDPMILPKKALFSADAHPTNSAYTVYDRNGNPIRRQVYRNNRLIGN